MRWLVNYLRQVFCHHDWERSEKRCIETDNFGGRTEGDKVCLICRKCGYHQSFWKF